MTLLKTMKRLCDMAKNARQKGKSMRNGNAPSPYTKHNKTPYRYSPEYYQWKMAKIKNKPQKEAKPSREYKLAAE